jgi:hypothetical protein
MIVTAPDSIFYMDGNSLLFLGGGISGCPDWQTSLLNAVAPFLPHVGLLNPRRTEFDVNDPSMSDVQIEWEFHHLTAATEILFWFPKETLCPITLYELGAWSRSQKKLFIGTDPGYARAFDVEKQTKLVRPEIEIVHSINDLAKQVLEYYGEK